MKLSLINLTIISFASACSALKVNEGFLKEEEIDQFRGRLPKIDKQPNGAARHHGVASLPASIARRMLSSICSDDGICANKGVEFDLEVRTSLIDRSTDEHVDHYSDGEKVHEDVGFVFLNSNPNAHFQHGKETIPIKAGNLVTFKGDVTHNTVVKSGQVHLLGPFDMVSFKGVGGVPPNVVCFDPVIDCCGADVALLIDAGQGGCCTGDNCRPNNEVTNIGDCTACFLTFQAACLAACACDKKKKKSHCFSPANTVEVQDQGLISMDSLKIGDYVRAGKNKFSRVYSFLHLDHEAEADFLQIKAEGLKTPLEVSPEHMVFVKDTPVRASQVKVGDMLGENKVSDIKSVKRRGVYAPVTESGSIVVSGVLASSYAAVRSYSLVNQHLEAHALFAVRRLVCAFDFSMCERETYTDGFPNWLSSVVYFAKSTAQNAPAQVIVSAVALPFIAFAYILEQMILYPFLLGVLMLVLVAFKKKTNMSKVKVQ